MWRVQGPWSRDGASLHTSQAHSPRRSSSAQSYDRVVRTFRFYFSPFCGPHSNASL